MSVPYIVITVLSVWMAVFILLRLLVRENQRFFPVYDVGQCMTIGTREVQEDNYLVADSVQGMLGVLADGMGKCYGGKIASRIVIETFDDLFQEYNAFDNPGYYFRKAFQASNREILKAMDDGRGSASVAAVMIQNGMLFYALVGNVKIAIFRNGDLVPVSSGHTINVLAKEKYQQGSLTRQDAIRMLDEHRLYNYVGQDGFRDIEFMDEPVKLNRNDVVVLLSDGIFEQVTWKRMEEILSHKGNCQEKALAMVEEVNNSDAEDKDNASVVLIRILA